MQQDLEEPFGPGDYDPVIADPLDPAAANHVASRVARDPLGGGILEEGTALGAVYHHAVEDRLDHGRRGHRCVASAGVEKVAGGDRRITRQAGIDVLRCRCRCRYGRRPRRGRRRQRASYDERAPDACNERNAHNGEHDVEGQESSRHA